MKHVKIEFGATSDRTLVTIDGQPIGGVLNLQLEVNASDPFPRLHLLVYPGFSGSLETGTFMAEVTVEQSEGIPNPLPLVRVDTSMLQDTSIL